MYPAKKCKSVRSCEHEGNSMLLYNHSECVYIFWDTVYISCLMSARLFGADLFVCGCSSSCFGAAASVERKRYLSATKTVSNFIWKLTEAGFLQHFWNAALWKGGTWWCNGVGLNTIVGRSGWEEEEPQGFSIRPKSRENRFSYARVARAAPGAFVVIKFLLVGFCISPDSVTFVCIVLLQ